MDFVGRFASADEEIREFCLICKELQHNLCSAGFAVTVTRRTSGKVVVRVRSPKPLSKRQKKYFDRAVDQFTTSYVLQTFASGVIVKWCIRFTNTAQKGLFHRVTTTQDISSCIKPGLPGTDPP